MPVHAEDAIWGATDKEMVRCRGSFNYTGWTLCGGKKPYLSEPAIYDVSNFNWVTTTSSTYSTLMSNTGSYFDYASNRWM